MTYDNRVYGYFNKNNYEYLTKLKNKLEIDGIKTSKSKILELGVIELRKKNYDEIKEKIGEVV